MIIRSNVPALNAYNKLNRNRSSLSKNLEKLSSGYRINNAGDDAAGLAISEKIRAILTGMDRAESNSQEGITLIKTGEGALQEVHDMLNRLKELAVQSSNGTYDDAIDRANLQEELEALCEEIDRIATSTNFNGVHLFQDIGLEAESSAGAATELFDATAPNTTKTEAAPLTLADVLADQSDSLKNIIYTKTTFDFETTQTPATDSTTNTFSADYQALADELQTAIVPQVVTAIMKQYPAFDYLTGSSIGIGLRLYDDSTTSTLASVSVGTSYSTSSGGATTNFLTYTLSVNVATLKNSSGAVDISDTGVRSGLEQTIAHEMIHAFMDEATTAGMIGVFPTGANSSQEFPDWFVEGMAQTASGPGNWTRGQTLNLDATSTTAEISTALSGHALGSGTTGSEYGTGYLACMYLGYLAAGADANMSSGTAAAADIASGVSHILSELISGKSLQTVISEVTGGRYASVTAFQSGFHTDADALAFIQSLLQYTSDDPDGDGNVGGGLISGDLSGTDPVADTDISGLKLFALDTDNSKVKNEYPSEVTVLSGGGLTISGTAPITPTTPITYPPDVFTVTGGTAGTTAGDGDYWFDTSTGTLHIYKNTALTISGGTKTDSGTTYYGNIVVADGVDANLTLSGVSIDASKKSGDTAGIAIGDNSNATITVSGPNNTITGGDKAAGIQLSDNDDTDGRASVTIDMQTGSVLNVSNPSTSYGGAGIGGAYGAGAGASDIIIQGSGTLTVAGGECSAAIGGGGDSYSAAQTDTKSGIGNITITGGADTLTINATGGYHGAGIGGGFYTNLGDITITGSVNITAKSDGHATGIGSGCGGGASLGGEVGTITIGTSGGADNSTITINATGGSDGAAIGAGWTGSVDAIIINGGTINADAGTRGAGIGSGYRGESGEIVINGGTIAATGSTNASGIGSGMSGTISGVTINGGTITANGGWTNDGGNIGGYTDSSGTNKATVTITDPSGLTIKAGEKGEGKYIVNSTGAGGAVDSQGNTLYALDLSYISQLLADGKITPLTNGGTDPASLSYPLASVGVTTSGGTTYSWANLQHTGENSAYIWMKGEDITLTFKDADGTEATVTLKFFEDYGLWRFDEADLPDEIPQEPGYVLPDPPAPPDTPDPPDSPDPPDPPVQGIILHVGADSDDTFEIPRFYFSRAALGLDELDISTQENAQSSIEKVDNMINRVSDIRGTYGAMQNALDHIINNLYVGIENLSSTESQIRDTDMAEEMMQYTKNNILMQAAQAMLAQANMLPQGVMQLLQ